MQSVLPTPALNEHRSRFSRRALVGSGLAGMALWVVGSPRAGARSEAAPTDPASWHTWLLDSAAELRPAQPPAPTQAEIDELLAHQALRTDATAEMVARWGSRPAVLPWTDVALDLIKEHKPGPRRPRPCSASRRGL